MPEAEINSLVLTAIQRSMKPSTVFLGGALVGAFAVGGTFFVVDNKRAMSKVRTVYNALTWGNLVGTCGTVWLTTKATQFCVNTIRNV